MIKTLKSFTVLSLVLCFSSGLMTEAAERQMRKPPQEAYDICEDKNEADVVTITTPDGDEVEATCQLMDDELVAVPDNHPQRGRSKGNRG
ncbi:MULTISPECIES: hypothetical protein [Shewanella]|uniref:Uncharacterized protein n=1 Tax=Shewanella japonica TaxID=93973 RepID=A0ABM6JNF1_9GAMM|nr:MULTISPECIES: hypothetical protein [Shewanella]ARD22820.1 hypothetical protein SJ2017_2530 [Shewanella japonica]KPZ67824.1 hypothetical protein AN944_03925 [Shewanella sp. P1-14-1]MBQ4889259.1 hypothetical protein [Shewanella sp. MMG014]OBT11078.1 hypothetical protein A9267_00025 [Shewanella sp. UCD-FRSSP16_17]